MSRLPHRLGTLLALGAGSARFGSHACVFVSFHGGMAGDHRRALGRRGEDLAATHLERHGWRIVERNFRTRAGEIDLIAARRGTLAFCEVKTLIARRAPPASGPANPVESVGPAKRSRVRRMARAWLADGRDEDQEPRHRCVRLDVIGVLLAPDGTLLRLEHLESAF